MERDRSEQPAREPRDPKRPPSEFGDEYGAEQDWDYAGPVEETPANTPKAPDGRDAPADDRSQP